MTNAFENVLSGLESQANSNIPVEPDDYKMDGLWHCGKCHTPKQVRLEFPWGERCPMALCKCQAEKRKAEEEEIRIRERNERIKDLRKMGFPESEMDKWTFDIDDGANPKVTNVAKNFVQHFDKMLDKGKGLLLYGTVGTGKTFYSACIVNALIDRVVPCMMTNFARIVNTISGMYEGKQEYIDGLNKFDLLVIDDLAAERDTEYMNEIVQNIIDCRYRAKLPTIITTNLSADEIKNPADIRKQRTYSRLLEMCIPVEVVGADRRRKKLNSDYKELNDILGL